RRDRRARQGPPVVSRDDRGRDGLRYVRDGGERPRRRTHRRRFPILFFLILLVMAGYTVFWFYAKGEAEKRFADAVAAMRARGDTIQFSSAEWSGFPIRFQVDLKDFVYRGNGVEAEAALFHAEVLPWDPTRALLRFDGQVRLAA